MVEKFRLYYRSPFNKSNQSFEYSLLSPPSLTNFTNNKIYRYTYHQNKYTLFLCF